MKNAFIIFTANLLFSIFIYAQPNIDWRDVYGGAGNEYGTSFCSALDGGYAVTGFTSSFGAVNGDLFLLKTDESGEIEWLRTYGGAERDYGQCVKILDDGGFIIAGYTESFGAGSEDVFLIRTEANGDTIWTSTFGGIEGDKGRSVVPTAGGGFMVVGTTLSYGAGGADIYIIRTDDNGDSLWTSTYGFEGYEKGYSICLTDDGCFVISGYTNSYGYGSADVLLMKIDVDGEVLWTQNYGGSGFEEGICSRQTTDEGLIICGRTGSFGAGANDVYVIRTDENGDPLWTNTYGGILNDEGFSIVETDDSGFIISGRSESSAVGGFDVLLMEIDSTGNELWSTTFGGTRCDWGMSIEQTSETSYIVSGTSESFGNGGFDVFLMEFGEIPVDFSTIIGIVENYDITLTAAPNPFNAFSTIRLCLTVESKISLKIYNLSGEEIVSLIEGNKSAGHHEIIWDASDLPSGMYFVRLSADNLQFTRKLLLLK